jgi:ribosomal subunit interface protein
VDIVVKSRHTEVSERFRRHAAEKLAKIEQLDSKVIRIDVEVSKEHNPRLADLCERIELTCRSKGPVIRAEAAADDKYAALDMAFGKLESRLRRAADRRRVHHGGKTPVSVASATAGLSANGDGPGAGALVEASSGEGDVADPDLAHDPYALAADGPMVIREKVHEAAPMTLDQALYEMELVGHDFFLFVDADSARPSVIYRRRGYHYGVIRLELAS